MKSAPFSGKDRARIIRTLHETGRWEGHRHGVLVRFQIARSLFGSEIAFEYHLQRKKHLEKAATVALAIEKLNRILKHRSAIKEIA